jgi:hypothetical protein
LKASLAALRVLIASGLLKISAAIALLSGFPLSEAFNFNFLISRKSSAK